MAIKSTAHWLRTALRNNLTEFECNQVNELDDSIAQCNFVTSHEDCDYNGVFFSYINLTYCTLNQQRALAILILISFLLILFLCMGTIADDFLCPSLLSVSKTFRLPDHIAGVTFLAFGNGAPDIFSSIGGITKSKPQLIFSSLYGGGIFVTTLVTGSVLITGNFTLMKRPTLRDIIFYIFAAFLVWLFVFSKNINLFKSVSLIVYYILYIAAVVIGRYIYVRLNPEKSSTTDESDKIAVIEDIETTSSDSRNLSNSRQNSNKSLTLSYDQDSPILARYNLNGTNRSKKRSKSDAAHAVHHHFENSIIYVSNILESEYHTKAKEIKESNVLNNMKNLDKKPKPFLKQDSVMSILSRESFVAVFNETRDFFIHISPIDMEAWPEMAWHSKIISIIRAIPYFIMTICIPVVDLESDKDNWCRLLVCLNMILGPQIVLYFLKNNATNIGVISLWSICLVISMILVLVILFTSEKDKPPAYHRAFALVGFIVSVIFIHSIADEIISVLQTCGIIFQLSDSILGLTVLAWGNSLGDLIANMSLARAGYPAMAISACFGGPMLNLLMGIGIPYTVLFSRNSTKRQINVKYGNMMRLLFVTLTLSLMISLFYFIFNRFHSSKIHGYLLICLYLVYTTLAFLIEYDIIPDH